MTDINYPPQRTTTLDSALDDIEARLDDLETTIDRLEGDDTADEQTLRERRSERQQVATYQGGLQWAISEFGGDAELTIEAHTTARRSRVLDAASRHTMGELGQSQLNDWMQAAAIVDAPWLDGGEDLRERHGVYGALPPALSDWIGEQVAAVNDLGN